MEDNALNPEELNEIDTIMKRTLMLAGRRFAERYNCQQDVPADRSMLTFLLSMTVPWNIFRAVERQEIVIKRMDRQSWWMTVLTIAIAGMTVAVVVLSAIQVWWIIR